jgi:quercetin dioxygenase-like cupin family protein
VRIVVPQAEGTQLPGDFQVLITVRGEDTGGAMAVVEETIQPRAIIPPHVHENDVWVYVLSGRIGVLVGEEVVSAETGSWALKPRAVMHAMWNADDEPARVLEVLTPAGTEKWFEEIASLPTDDNAGFRSVCDRYGIRFLPDSPWTSGLRTRLGL